MVADVAMETSVDQLLTNERSTGWWSTWVYVYGETEY